MVLVICKLKIALRQISKSVFAVHTESSFWQQHAAVAVEKGAKGKVTSLVTPTKSSITVVRLIANYDLVTFNQSDLSMSFISQAQSPSTAHQTF